MAIRYVKDFEFPSAAGYSKSSPSKVTGQMLAKGGQPKGMMVIIGVGKPKRPMKRAEGGTTDTTPNPHLGPGPLQIPSDEQINKENWNQRKAIRRAMGAKNTGKDVFAKGGKVAKVMHEFGEGKLHSGSKKGPKVTNPKQAIAIALSEAGKSKKAEGGMAHEDVAADKSLIKSMVKPAALKKAMGGQAVQMAKSNAIEASMKGQKKTGYADGGGIGLSPPQIASPLQKLANPARQVQMPKAIPVATRAPMIPQQAAPAAGAPRIGVNRSRSGKPDVGAIRAAMARAATQAAPENAPGMMKKGGKVKC